LPENISKFNLRKNPNWEQELEKQDFGLITKRNDLDNLEVLVLEVSPSPNYKNDEDIIKAILAKWFKEMKVKRVAIYNSDLPQYTKQHIDEFIK
jgi:2-phospho-L-lactate guanylyltransferase (CobY/MobA/RfbA family)